MGDSASTSERVWLAGRVDCEAHLVQVAEEASPVTLSTDDIQVQGRLGRPDRDGRIPFFPHAFYQGLPLGLPLGSRVRLDYHAPGGACSFRSRVRERDPGGHLLLDLPSLVTRSERRLAPRFRTEGDPSFQVFVQDAASSAQEREVALYDISTGGLAWILGEADVAPRRGDHLCVSLHLPSVGPILCLVRVAHIRPVPGELYRHIVGVRFFDLDVEDQMKVALSLTTWRQGRHM